MRISWISLRWLIIKKWICYFSCIMWVYMKHISYYIHKNEYHMFYSWLFTDYCLSWFSPASWQKWNVNTEKHGQTKMTKNGRVRWSGPLKKMQKKQMKEDEQWLRCQKPVMDKMHKSFRRSRRKAVEKKKNEVFVVRVFREKARTFLWAILWLSFPLAHIAHKEVAVISSVHKTFFWGC